MYIWIAPIRKTLQIYIQERKWDISLYEKQNSKSLLLEGLPPSLSVWLNPGLRTLWVETAAHHTFSLYILDDVEIRPLFISWVQTH